MGIHDAVKKLAENQEEAIEAKVEEEKVGEDEQPSPVRDQQLNEQISSAETDRLEKLLFKFSAMLDKTEAERKEMKTLYQEVDTQKETVGKMLVSLDSVIKGLPNTIDASVKASLDRNAASIDHAAAKVAGEMERQVSNLTNKVVKILADNLSVSITEIKTAASNTVQAAASMITAKDYVGWRDIAVNVGVSCLMALTLLGVVNRRFPWQLRGPNAQEQTYIERGKALTKSWSQLPPKLQTAISRELTENE